MEECVEEIAESKRALELAVAQRDLGVRLGATSRLGEALPLCLDTAIRVARGDSGEVYLVDRASGAVVLATGTGYRPECLCNCRSHPDWCVGTLTAVAQPVYTQHRTPCEVGQHVGCGATMQARAIIPISHEGTIIGWLVVKSHSASQVPDLSRGALETIATQIGTAIARIQAQEAVVASQGQLKALLDSLDDFLFVVDSQGRILEANRAGSERLGSARENLRGKRISEVLSFRPGEQPHHRMASASPETPDFLVAAAVAGDETVVPMEIRLGLGIWDGQRVSILLGRDLTERWRAEEQAVKLQQKTAQALRADFDLGVVYLTAHSDERTLERAEATEPCGYLVKPYDGTTLQTTLQMAVHKSIAERERRIGHRRQTAVLNQLTVGLIVADAAGKVTTINAPGQSLTGWVEQEALGQDIAQVLVLYGNESAPITGDRFGKALRKEKSHAIVGRARLLSKSRTETWVEHRASPVQDESQQVVGASLVFWPVEPSSPRHAQPADGQDLDSATGLPGRAQAIAEIQAAQAEQTGFFAALFVVDRHYLITRRYGIKAADEALTYYATLLAQELPQCRGLFRWTGPCFLALIGPLCCLQSAQRLISRRHLAPHPLFQPSGTSAMLPISGSAEVYPIDDTPTDVLVRRIDSYVATQTKAQTY